jgi:6-pyruvoyltetrahydropterin/6-carboxytetrahydropterin synthase
MFRLSREVRFSINAHPDGPPSAKPTNSYAGFPTLTGPGHWFTLSVCLRGPIDARTSYLRNIREIDDVVRQTGVAAMDRAVRCGRFGARGEMLGELFTTLRGAWPGAELDTLTLALSPFVNLSIRAKEFPMIRLSQKFEFSASHRLHNPALSDEANRAFFGKCNNAAGHGHNYEVQVTVAGAGENAVPLASLPELERIVASRVIDRFDHKHLNHEVPEFAQLNPTVENIAKVIFELLRPSIANLVSVTVWETPKTWCEFTAD